MAVYIDTFTSHRGVVSGCGGNPMGVGVCIFSKGPDATSALLVDIIEPVSIVLVVDPYHYQLWLSILFSLKPSLMRMFHGPLEQCHLSAWTARTTVF